MVSDIKQHGDERDFAFEQQLIESVQGGGMADVDI